MRVHELAKELGVPSKDLMKILRDNGVTVKTHMSSIEEDDILIARRALAVKPGTEKPAGTRKTESAGATAKTKADEKPAGPAKDAPKTKAPGKKPAKPGTPAPEAAAPVPPTPQPEKEKAAPPKKTIAEAPRKQEAAPTPPPTPAPEPQPAAPQPATDTEAPENRILRIRGGIVVRDLADMMGIKPNQVVALLMKLNIFANINAKLEFDVAEKVAREFGYEVEHEKKTDQSASQPERTPEEQEDRPEDLMPRPSVVTFLGHVDHGKTSLMDRIRSASVVTGESGGITQHIGAYMVDVAGHEITFLDTPGHAAFTAMRARGANLTDIAVIIIAADDGIMPQTKEAIAHAKAADVAIMVAINKCDLPAANPDRVLQQLQAEGLSPEDWGGETICCKVSAITGEGIDHLLEMILLQAEMQELSANPRRPASGFVIEAELQPGMGPTVSLLVTSGTLKVGDAILCGPYWGRVRALMNEHGKQVKSAGPSHPVKCLGLSGVPEAGAEFHVLKNDRAARNLAGEHAQRIKEQSLEAPRKVSLDDLFDQTDASEKVELSLIIKADTQGSVEAIVHALSDINSEKVSPRFIHTGTGNITTNDVLLASASNAVILGFHVAKEPGVEAVAKREGVEVRLHQIIYELIDQVRDAMIGALGPRMEEVKRGQAQIRQIFEVGKGHKVAGCLVLKGTVNIKHRIRVKRKAEILFEGTMLSLKHFQDDVKEVREAQECGIRIKGFTDFIEGDIIESYEIEQHQQTL